MFQTWFGTGLNGLFKSYSCLISNYIFVCNFIQQKNFIYIYTYTYIHTYLMYSRRNIYIHSLTNLFHQSVPRVSDCCLLCLVDTHITLSYFSFILCPRITYHRDLIIQQDIHLQKNEVGPLPHIWGIPQKYTFGILQEIKSYNFFGFPVHIKVMFKGGTDIRNRLLDRVEEGEGGISWENSIETCTLPCIKQIVGVWCISQGTQSHCSVRTYREMRWGWRWDSCSRGRAHMNTYGLFMLMYGKTITIL